MSDWAKHRKTAELVMAGGEVSRLGVGVLQPQQPGAAASDAGDDDDEARIAGRPRLPGSKRQRPKQLATTVLLSPRPVANQVCNAM